MKPTITGATLYGHAQEDVELSPTQLYARQRARGKATVGPFYGQVADVTRVETRIPDRFGQRYHPQATCHYDIERDQWSCSVTEHDGPSSHTWDVDVARVSGLRFAPRYFGVVHVDTD